MSTSPVAFETLTMADGRHIGLATLDSERSLNALTLAMVEALLPQLEQWAADEQIAMVLLRGRGERAFCAGGDVRDLTQAARTGEGDALAPAQFFAREYRLDYLIHQYAKPLLVWGTGVVMGGGIGLFAGARYRVVTETSRLAMPEIGIGLYPDVGGSYILSRLRGRLGLFLGLGASQLNANDAMHLGLATHAVASSQWQALLDGLQALMGNDLAQGIDAVLGKLRLNELPVAQVEPRTAAIEALCAHDDLLALDAAWRGQDLPEDAWLAKAMKTYRGGSPTSAALIWKQWHDSKAMSLLDVFRQEWIISTQCAFHADFPEGVRALLVDKDLAPRWQPATLAEVSADFVAEHYVMPEGMTQPLADL
ncbi:MAG: enoyl-CoA hydratase/isomerase family protein [Paraperlucidibaca sp.]